MPLKNIIKAIENKQLLVAHELLEKTLYTRAGVLLEEKKKQVAAKVFPIKEADEKTIFKADQRKALKEKMKKVGTKKPKAEK